jgi:anti-sigma factor RsiW
MTGSISDAQLHAFFDGQLDEGEEREVLAYLQNHPEVLRRFRELDHQRHEVAHGFEDLSDDYVDPATEALAARLAERVDRGNLRLRVRRILGLSTAAVALLAAGWVSHTAWVGQRAPDLPPLLADAARDHQIFASAGTPVEIAGTEEELMLEIFASHLGEEVQIPNLGDYGYQLVGGRLLGAAEGPFVQLLYDDGENHPLTLYVAKQPFEDEGLRFTEVEGLGASYWKRQALAYALVADAPLPQVERIATALATPR